ncbi:MAG: TetR/AcrR family transcriptional regulator [Pseudomonadota bacterium]
MGRPRQFDEEQVLDQAMKVFWRQGYAATSIKDLVGETGLNPGSLYEAFGDKHDLFLAAISHYRGTIVRRRLEEMAKPGPGYDRIAGFFNDLVQFSTGEGRLMGCLMTNSAVELAPHDRDVAVLVAANLMEMERAFHGLVVRGQQDGSIVNDDPPDELARFLTVSVQGLRVMSKANPDEAALNGVVRQTLSVLR